MAQKRKPTKVNLLRNVSDIFIKRDDIYSKFEKLYLKDKDNYDNQLKERRIMFNNMNDTEEDLERRRIILSVIVREPEDKILKILDKYYHDIIQNISNGIRFEECKLPEKSYKIIDYYIMYKFISILMDKKSTLNEYDEQMLMLIDKINNYTKEEAVVPKKHKSLFPMDKPTSTGVTEFFYGSAELYSFFISALLDNNIPADILETTKLTKRDMEDIAYYIQELFFNNRVGSYDPKECDSKIKWIIEAAESLKNKDNFIPFKHLRDKSMSINSIFNDSIYMLYLMGAIIKVFTKLRDKDKDKYNDLLKKYKSLVAINENRIQDKKDIENLDSLRKEIENLKEKNKELTIEKERLNKRYDILNDENNNLKNNIKSLNKDVEDLREILNIMDPEDETEDKLTSQVDRIVLTEEEEKTALLIGGHIRFQQKVLEKYPNLRTVTVDIARVNVQLIKNSKLVLLNVKYMSHKLFESVMNVVKKNNIEFRYV